ncbi:mannose-6-phosphate isomerase, class I [Reichenbachiella carrageenanivorans]|uniref:mannose-6-phosphate isomerase n=1 Tax=Reichenbachiella carrageenanivorans TaxID=2979869 RepID=A0ABY6CZM6_9BACT|nr:mannose-6-phosphate isomerase, class I [Reichenbachiella carrageenanivorans]UXX79357.1 mannose-6-phosphate isomerase, class I [Reichenbachiella carrageenanivorans]
MSKIYSLKGKIQNYAWGGQEYIPQLLNITAEDKPYAEYWMGAHVNAPALVSGSEGEETLDGLIAKDLMGSLGSAIASKFGRLSFLFKVLDVKDMLSIQVHPTKVEAEKGFARENEQGIPLNAPHRNYKDDNHKPEIMVALSEFWLLHGFLPEDQLVAVLQNTPAFEGLEGVFATGGYRALYQHVMELSDDESNTMLQPLVDRILPLYRAGELDKSSPDYWAAKAVDTATEVGALDRGIYSIYFFNIVKAEQGQAVFQGAGIPHAYLEGQNMELMANSDNVLRGGLTPKHVDVPELLKHVEFKATHPQLLSGELQADGLERIYVSPAPDFQLSKIDLGSNDIYQMTGQTAEILIVLDGEAEVKEDGKVLTLGRGEAAFVLAGANYQITTKSTATLYKASAPVD